jgi:hypothetical protein
MAGSTISSQPVASKVTATKSTWNLNMESYWLLPLKHFT